MTQTLIELFACHAEERPNRPFLHERESGLQLNYGEALARVACAAESFRRRGVLQGDRIAILIENRIEWVIAFLAAQTIGAIAVPMNTRLASNELRTHIDDCDPAIIVVEAIGDFVMDADDPRLLHCSNLTSFGASFSLSAQADDPAIITYTSGTTGAPKGVVLSHRAVHLSSTTYAGIFNSDPDFATAIAVPLFHNTGFIDGLGHAIVAGGSAVLFRRFDPVTIANGLSKGEITFFIGVPTMYRRILDRPATVGRSKIKAIPWLAYGGAPMPATIAKLLFQDFPRARMVNCYGMSEATSITHYLPAHLSYGRWDAVGIPVPGTADHIDQYGELEINSPTAMLGYWQRGRIVKSDQQRNWIHTGDCATRDELGLVRITGRTDDLINRGGEKIAPLQVESAICQLDGILDVAVVGMPDPDLGQVPAALIVSRKSNLDENSIRESLVGLIADYKIPTHIYLVDELPRNANGKVMRSRVRQIIAQQLDRNT